MDLWLRLLLLMIRLGLFVGIQSTYCLSCGGAPGRSHLVGGPDLSRTTQFGMRCRGKGNTTLPGCDKSSPAGGIPARTYLHVRQRKEDDFGYGCAHTIRSRTSGCTVHFSSDKQDVHGCVRQGWLASWAPDTARWGVPTVTGLGV
jgi:hypothetical protein